VRLGSRKIVTDKARYRRQVTTHLAVIAAFVVPTILYLLSIEPDVASWDVGEMQTVAYIAGIGHSTGYPSFILAGWVFSHAFAIGSVAWRMNLLGALYLAGACSSIAYLQIRLGVKPVISTLSAIFFATGPIVWSHAVRVDVLSMATLFATLILLALILGVQDSRQPWSVVAFALVGASLGDHLVVLWLLPATAVFIGLNRSLLVWKQLAIAIAVGAATAVCIYAYLPIRSAIVTSQRDDPTLILGLPVGQAFWDYAHPSSLSGFIRLVTGAQVHASSSFVAMLNLRTFAAGTAHFLTMSIAEFSIFGVALVIIGLWVSWRTHRDVSIFIVLSCLFIAQFTAAFAAESDPDRYYMISFALLTIFLGAGAGTIADLTKAKRRSFLGAAVATALCLLVGVGILRERALFGWHSDHWGSDYTSRIRSLTPADAVIIAPWVVASPLAYSKYVERSYGDRIVHAALLMDDAPYLSGWVDTRPVYVVLDHVAPQGFCLKQIGNGDPPLFRVLRVNGSVHNTFSLSRARIGSKAAARPRYNVSC
jgi:Protein of unknown function (DUF2723)